MKGKWKQDILSLMTFVLCSKDSLGQTKGMSNVQVSIGVGIGKGDNELFLLVIVLVVSVGVVSCCKCIRFKGFTLVPLRLDCNFISSKGIALWQFQRSSRRLQANPRRVYRVAATLY